MNGYVLLGILSTWAWAAFGGLMIWSGSKRKDLAQIGLGVLFILTLALAVQLWNGGMLPA